MFCNNRINKNSGSKLTIKNRGLQLQVWKLVKNQQPFEDWIARIIVEITLSDSKCTECLSGLFKLITT
jgi:hypothetical protein